MGFPESTIVGIGSALLARALLFFFPILFAVLIWAGLLLRDNRLRRILLRAEDPS